MSEGSLSFKRALVVAQASPRLNHNEGSPFQYNQSSALGNPQKNCIKSPLLLPLFLIPFSSSCSFVIIVDSFLLLLKIIATFAVRIQNYVEPTKNSFL